MAWHLLIHEYISLILITAEVVNLLEDPFISVASYKEPRTVRQKLENRMSGAEQ